MMSRGHTERQEQADVESTNLCRAGVLDFSKQQTSGTTSSKWFMATGENFCTPTLTACCNKVETVDVYKTCLNTPMNMMTSATTLKTTHVTNKKVVGKFNDEFAGL